VICVAVGVDGIDKLQAQLINKCQVTVHLQDIIQSLQ
jgi:hypothetical protein